MTETTTPLPKIPVITDLAALENAFRFKGPLPFRHPGFCPICDKEVTFTVKAQWLRDYYNCDACGSIPRERAIKRIFDKLYPSPKGLITHESSPSDRSFSKWLRLNNPNHIVSQYYPDRPLGAIVNGTRNEDLENLSFADNSIDVHITQDVFEHIMRPGRAFAEIERTLKPGGAHIFTVPTVKGKEPSARRADLRDGQVEFLQPAKYHGSPIDAKGTLVTYDYGYDIVEIIAENTRLRTVIWAIDSLYNGIRAFYTEVFVSTKPQKTTTNAALK